MPVREMLAGLGMLQDSFEKKTARKFDLQKMLEDQKFQEANREDTQQFQTVENDKNRASDTERAKISVGPAYAKINLERQQIQRQNAAEEAAANRLEANIEGSTLKGGLTADLVRGGAMTGAQAVGSIADRSSGQWIADLNAAAMSTQDPVRAKELRVAANQAMEVQNILAENESYRKRIAETRSAGNQFMDYEYDPAPIMPAVSSIIKKSLPEYDPEDMSMIEYYTQRSKKDPNFRRETVREEMNKDLAVVIQKSDPTLGGDYLRAQQAASAIWEKIELGGLKNMLMPDNIDEEGNAKGGKYKGFRPIRLRIDKSAYFTNTARPGGIPVDEAPSAAAAKPVAPGTGMTVEQSREFYRSGKTPVTDAAR